MTNLHTESRAGKVSTLSSNSAGSSSLIFGPLRPAPPALRFALHSDLDSQAKSKVNRENSQRNRVK